MKLIAEFSKLLTSLIFKHTIATLFRPQMGYHPSSVKKFSENFDKKAVHTTYNWNIKWQKCSRMGLNGFHIR